MNNWMRNTIVFGLLSVSSLASAAQLDLIIGSKHSQSGAYVTTGEYVEFNETNPGLMYTADSNWVVGGYKNSFDKVTMLAGHSFETAESLVNAGIVVGLATGYEQVTGRAITPMAMPYVTLGPKAFRAKIGLLPGEISVVTFMLNVEI